MQKALFFFLVSLMVFSTGCIAPDQPAPKIDFYTFEYTPPSIPAILPLPVVLDIRRFSIVPDYNTMRMVFKDTPFERNEYVYHRWHADPADLVTAFLRRDFQFSGQFLAVDNAGMDLPATYTLNGSVDAMYEHDLPQGWESVLGLTITLSKTYETNITKSILFQRSYATATACTSKSPVAVAQAMSEAMHELSQQIQIDVTLAITDNLKK